MYLSKKYYRSNVWRRKEDFMNEQWLPVKRFEGLYEVSNYGRYRALPKLRGNKNNLSLGYYIMLIELRTIDNGLYMRLKAKGRGQTYFSLGKAVAESFIPNPLGYKHIRYLDGDSTHCNCLNIVWCANNGKPSTRCKVVIMLSLDGEPIRSFPSTRKAAEIMHFSSHSKIGQVCNGKSITAFGYKWKWKEDKND